MPRIRTLEMSEEATACFPSEKLTIDGDFAMWKFVAEVYFIVQGIHKLILGIDKAPDVPETGATAEQRNSHDSWCKRDQ